MAQRNSLKLIDIAAVRLDGGGALFGRRRVNSGSTARAKKNKRPSADAEHVPALIPTLGRSDAALVGLMHVLALPDQVEQGPQPLVFGDGGLVDLPDLVEGAIGEVDAVVADHQAAVGTVVDGDALADRRLGGLRRLQNEHHLVVLQGQRLGQGAFHAPGEGLIEVVAAGHGPVQILGVGGGLGETGVVVSEKSREEGVAALDGADAGEPVLRIIVRLRYIIGNGSEADIAKVSDFEIAATGVLAFGIDAQDRATIRSSVRNWCDYLTGIFKPTQ